MKFILDTHTDIRDLALDSYYRQFVQRGFYQRFVATNYGMLCYGDTPQGALDVLHQQLDVQCMRFRDDYPGDDDGYDLDGMRERLTLNGESWTEVDDGREFITLVTVVNTRGQALLDKDSHEVLPEWVDPASVEGSRAWYLHNVKALFAARREGGLTREDLWIEFHKIRAIYLAHNSDV